MSVENITKLSPPSPIEAIRVIYRVGVKIAGHWSWNDLEIPQPTVAAPNVQPLRRASDKPKTQLPVPLHPQERVTAKPAEPKFMINGRDPAKFEMIFGKFYRENGDKPIALEKIDIYALEKYRTQMKDEQNPSPKLEVALEMISAFLHSRQVPTSKTRKGAYGEPRN